MAPHGVLAPERVSVQVRLLCCPARVPPALLRVVPKRTQDKQNALRKRSKKINQQMNTPAGSGELLKKKKTPQCAAGISGPFLYLRPSPRCQALGPLAREVRSQPHTKNSHS